MADTFNNNSQTLDGPAWNAAAVTPNDSTDLAFTSRALYVGTAGNITVDMVGTGEAVLFKDVAVGYHPLRVTRVYSTGTAASDIVALW